MCINTDRRGHEKHGENVGRQGRARDPFDAQVSLLTPSSAPHSTVVALKFSPVAASSLIDFVIVHQPFPTLVSCPQAMAGLGRRTHYRKHLTDSVLNDLPEPSEREQIARVVSTRGGNHFDICLAHDETVYLAILPTKFHKLVWVKRGDYVLVDVGTNATHDNALDATKNKSDDDGGIRHMISHILYKNQVKHLKSKGLWPEDDPEFEKGSGAQEGDDNEDLEEHEDGIVYHECGDDVDDDLFVNTNRIARLEIQESDDDDDDGSDEASEC